MPFISVSFLIDFKIPTGVSVITSREAQACTIPAGELPEQRVFEERLKYFRLFLARF